MDTTGIFPIGLVILLLINHASLLPLSDYDDYFEHGEENKKPSEPDRSVPSQSEHQNKRSTSQGNSAVVNKVIDQVTGYQGNETQLFVNVGLRQDYLIQHCGEGNNLKYSFPDVDYALLGYDILTGYPMAMGADPGFTYPIFYADYSESTHTGDCRYSVPRGLVILPDVSCDVSFSSSVVKTSRQYESQLSVSAHVSGGGWGVQFSASAGYNKASSTLANGEYCYIISTATCNYYKSKLQDMKHPKFDDSFIEWVRKLEKSNKDEDYLEFFQRYGTHYPTEVVFGARFMHQHKMETSELTKMESQGVNVGVAASYSGLFSVGGGFNLDSSQRSQASDFSQKVETKVITVGAAPPANGDAMTWASSVQQNPVPTSYKLDSVSNLFTERYMKDLNVDYDKIRKNVQDKRRLYWQSIQRQHGANDFNFDIAGSVLVPNWYVQGEYEETDVTYTDCYRICSNLGSDCYGVSFCEKCIEHSKSKCSIFGRNSRARDWHFDEEWQTVIVQGQLNLNGMVVADTLGEALEVVVVNTKGTDGTTAYTRALEECKRKFQEHRVSSIGDKAVAYSFGFMFSDSFAFCKVYASRRILTIETRQHFTTVIEV